MKKDVAVCAHVSWMWVMLQFPVNFRLFAFPRHIINFFDAAVLVYTVKVHMKRKEKNKELEGPI